ncbi:YegP family protein [Sphingomonas sp. HMP6]|uniref:YegP family protein n=1 Tax=Sphingomonas sp. HMP6 TaxID=1517551 RepID=UPI00159668CD|nr:DUF1508 domain-containing protein [Sphingomonas sp. HMP6]
MSDGITRISLDTANDGDRTDWSRLRALSDADIATAITEDADTFEIEASTSSGSGVRYVLYRSVDGGWHWVLKDRDGTHLAVSATAFASKEATARAIDALRSQLLTGDVKAA